jgi:hypothetical protein
MPLIIPEELDLIHFQISDMAWYSETEVRPSGEKHCSEQQT